MTQETKTLRDEFAIAAMSTLLDKMSLVSADFQGNITLAASFGQITEFSYQVADTMLKERTK